MTTETVVLDASALIDLLIDRPRGAAVRDRIAGKNLHVPANLDFEVAETLRRHALRGTVTSEYAVQRVHKLATAPFVRHPLPDLLAQAWSWRGRVTVADALYVALAEKLGAIVVTTDTRLAHTCTLARVPDE